MQIILGHTNTDFDSLAAMVIAAKLYPEAKLVFAGSQEKVVRDYLETNPLPHITFYKPKEIDLSKISELIIVDTRYANRLGYFKDLIGQKGIKIYAYDHHPLSQGDIKPDILILKEVGSTTTLLVHELKKRKIKISANEATLAATGIYEDTGHLTYLSTKKEDFNAVSYLLDCGARLIDIPSFIRTDLTKEQMPLFADMLKAMEYHYIDGVQIGISVLNADKYLGDLALFVHKLRDIGQIPAVFIMVQLKDRVQVIARSQTKSVDVALIMSELGGGGHRSAASAVIKNRKVKSVKKDLLNLLNQYIEPLIRAKDIMSSPVMSVGSKTTVEQVRKMILRYRHNAFPVMKGKEIIGVISKYDIDRAIHHGLANETIEKYMSRNVIELDIMASLHQIRDRMLEHNIGFLPITESGRLVGVITRSDILRITHHNESKQKYSNDNYAIPVNKALLKTKNIRDKLELLLPQNILDLLHQIGQVADEIGYSVYVVGGFVRDLLLSQPNYDLDIVVEGDGITFARRLSIYLQGNIKTHKRFNTAIVTTMEHNRIDIATARTEFYEYPAALPQVEASSIKHDLYRRDFTINAMAIKLNYDEFGYLYDYFNGEKDLHKGRIRLLHNLSFVEDPTRIFRAIRFEQRYQFQIDKPTRQAIRNAIDLEIFDKLANQRVREEVILILSEYNPWPAIKRMYQLNVLQFIHPHIRFSHNLEEIFRNIYQSIEWKSIQMPDENIEFWEINFLGLLDELSLAESLEVCQRLFIMKKTEALVKKIKENHLLDDLNKPENNSPSKIYLLLNEYRAEGLFYYLAKITNESNKTKIRNYLTRYRYQKIEITGIDLKEMGLLPGPRYKTIFHELLLAKLDGYLKSKLDELNWIKEHYIN